MKDPITKLYNGLTNKERAALFFQYATFGNEIETARVLSSVPRQTYSMTDLEFIMWSDGFNLLANMFAQEHWIARHGLVAAVLRLKIASAKNDAWEEEDAAIEELHNWSRMLLSLDAALLAVADKHGLDVNCVYNRASTKPYKPTKNDMTADVEIVEIWTDTFNVIMESSFG